MTPRPPRAEARSLTRRCGVLLEFPRRRNRISETSSQSTAPSSGESCKPSVPLAQRRSRRRRYGSAPSWLASPPRRRATARPGKEPAQTLAGLRAHQCLSQVSDLAQCRRNDLSAVIRLPSYAIHSARLGPMPDEQVNALLAAMAGMKPRDEIEGMLCGQLIATHQAAMECYRRAAISKQTFEGWRESLNQANKLCRTYAALAETLDRHRGKGQQRITVEHVNVHAGGQAIVGAVTPGVRSNQKLEDQSSAAREITHQPGNPMRRPDPERETVPVASGAGKAPV